MGAGAREPLVRRTADAMFATGAPGPVATIVGNASLSAPVAALVNGTAAHAHDFDDYEFSASTHPSAAIVPALLVMGGVNNPLHDTDIVEKFARCGGPQTVADTLMSGEAHRLFRFSSSQWTRYK